MFNQVILVGKVREIYEDHIDLGVRIEARNEEERIIPVEMNEEFISHLLLNNVCGIKGHIELFEPYTIKDGRDAIKIVCDKLTILDGRGKENGN